MTSAAATRLFEPGTTGWTVGDLSEADIQWQWSQGRYEIVEGVLTKMAPQGFQSIDPLSRLRRLAERHLDVTNQTGSFHNEVDVLLHAGRVVRPDIVYLTPAQYERQGEIEREQHLNDDDYRPLFVTPHLIVESLSPGHENHDRVNKRQWYAEAGAPHYWMLSAHERTMQCLRLENSVYLVESEGSGVDSINSTALGQITFPLSSLWRS